MAGGRAAAVQQQKRQRQRQREQRQYEGFDRYEQQRLQQQSQQAATIRKMVLDEGKGGRYAWRVSAIGRHLCDAGLSFSFPALAPDPRSWFCLSAVCLPESDLHT